VAIMMFRTRIAAMCSAAALAGLAATGVANAQEMQKPKAEPVTLTKAQVIDLHCFTAGGLKGDGHKECAIACAKANVPLGLLTADGKVLVPVQTVPMQDQNPKLQPFAEQLVNVKGKLVKGPGITGIIIDEVTKA
jgi:hypothetical protein